MSDVSDLDVDETEELMGALLELRSQFRKLQWFGEINRRGFVKITKKLDKKVPNSATQHRYIATKVDPKPFAKDNTIARLLNDINKWMSAVGDAQNVEDNRSERSIRSLGRASAKGMLTVPSALLDRMDQAIRDNNVEGLKSHLKEANLVLSDPPAQGLLYNLLQRSISARSKDSIEFILSNLKTLDEPDDINERNCIHRLVIHIGRTKSGNARDSDAPAYPFPAGNHYASQYITPAASPSASPDSRHVKETNLLDKNDEAVQVLIYLLDRLTEDQRPALSTRDSFGRLPLHYAAQFGFVVVCQIIMAKMQEWGQFNVEDGIDAEDWQDKEGNAPLHLAVIGGHPLTIQALLQGENWQGASEDKVARRRGISKSSAVLAIATKSNFKTIVKLLVEAGVDINWQDSSGETALHIAARFGHDECARILMEGTEEQKADLELVERNFNWTPLHIAAVDGHLSVAKLLMEAGADVDKIDSSGWTAREHAALRGHLTIADLLKENSHVNDAALSAQINGDGQSSTNGGSPPKVESLEDRRSKVTARVAEPVKTFGHRYLKDESLVLVSLGSMDMRRDVDAVKLDRVPLNEAHTTQLDTALSVVVSANGALGEPTIVDLPVHENISTEPIVFTTKDASKVKLLFDIVPTYSGNEKNKIGRAVALLSSIRPSVGSKRMNLQGDVCVPVVSSSTLEVIGTVNFNFLVVTPFSHPNMEVTSEQTYWKKLASTMVIGHRGLGKNNTSNKSLQLGENTVESFIAAANLGANYVEFDVQLTKDHVPVIYHDFLVSETGIDAPVHTLTLEQFLHINPDARRLNGKDMFTQQLRNMRENNELPGRKQRSMSVGYGVGETPAADERMKHTRDFKEKGYKGNSRGNFIQAPFATLEDLFRDLPSGVGFNIEMKYPMLHESEEHEMDAYAVELNSFCDTVLAKVYDLAKDRHIIFSSFNPDICLCLSYKQPNFPIMFLTDAGDAPVGDVRASSLQEAIRFASRWNLLGIVSASRPFTNSPRLVRVVKQHGLVCVSYGVENNDPRLVQVRIPSPLPSLSPILDMYFTDMLTQPKTTAPSKGRHRRSHRRQRARHPPGSHRVREPDVRRHGRGRHRRGDRCAAAGRGRQGGELDGEMG